MAARVKLEEWSAGGSKRATGQVLVLVELFRVLTVPTGTQTYTSDKLA